MIIVLYIFGALIIGLLVGAIWMPKTFHIEKKIVIEQPSATVIDHVANLNYYSKWNPWQQVDKQAVMTITGTPKTAGHKYEWKGPKVGQGHLTLLDLDNHHVHFSLQFIKPFKSTAKDNWHFEPWGENGTRVTWENSGNLPWPIARLVGPMMTKGLNKQFEKGLANLKSLCENTPAS
ncbi:MAG: hypothetical protein EOO09_08195 [Chitinophagaceae bacterium]|nr:MAG: hypothetical protein EOO09_08195 [Chitinophagaceae bacterium]